MGCLPYGAHTYTHTHTHVQGAKVDNCVCVCVCVRTHVQDGKSDNDTRVHTHTYTHDGKADNDEVKDVPAVEPKLVVSADANVPAKLNGKNCGKDDVEEREDALFLAVLLGHHLCLRHVDEEVDACACARPCVSARPGACKG